MNRFGVPLVILSILSGVAFGLVIATLAPKAPPSPLEVIQSPTVTVDLSPYVVDSNWQLVVLGYLRCPDVCPTTLSSLKGLLAQDALSGQPIRVLFVSVDPFRDSPDEVSDYAYRFGEQFTGVTANHAQLQNLTRELGVGYRVPAESEAFYLVSHSPVISIVDGRGQLRGRLRPGFEVQDTANQLSDLLTDI